MSRKPRQPARENIAYSSLSEIKSQAFSEFLRNISEFEDNVDEVNNILKEMKEGVASGDMKENQVFTEEWEEGTFKFKYFYKKSADNTKYLILRGAEFKPDGTLIHGAYFEVAVDKDGNPLKGQAQLAGNFSEAEFSGSHRVKLLFDQNNIDQKGYFEFSVTTAEGESFNEKGEIRIIGDTDDTKNGVFVATRFESDEWGTSQNLGWANDEYGGVMSHQTFSENGQQMEDVYTEYFKYNEAAKKSSIIYREWGTKNASEIFWDIGQARTTISTPSGWLNVYNSSVGSAPEKITVKFHEDLSSNKTYTIYAGEGTSGTTLVGTTSGEPWSLYKFYWLNPASATSISQGDAVYYFYNWSETTDASGFTAYQTYIKAAEVPATQNYMDKTGFYIENMYPLKYVTGNHPTVTSNTMIQKKIVDWNGNGVADPEDDWNENGQRDDYLYFLDLNGDGSWLEPYMAVSSSDDAEPEIMVWAFDEMYYDEATDSIKTDTGTAWLFGRVPTVDVNGDGTNDVTYLYQTEKDAAKAKFASSTDYITAISVTPYVIAGSEWEDFSLDDF